MIFKGIDFKQVHNIVSLPGSSPYIAFGKITNLGARKKGAVRSGFKYMLNKEKTEIDVYAVPIEVTGHSLTNMAYGVDGYTYLTLNGKFYRSAKKRG